MKDLSIARKFGIVLTALIAGFSALGLAYYQVTVVNHRASNEIQAINSFGELSDRINIQFLEMRDLEKEFMISRDEAFLERHAAAAASVESLISDVLEIAPDEATADLIEELSMYLMLYQGSFSEMANTMIAAGLNDNSGQRGDLSFTLAILRDIIGDASNAIELENALLQIRGLTRTVGEDPLPEFDDMMLERQAEFETLLNDSGLDSASREAVIGELQAYTDTFLAFAANERQYRSEADTFSAVAMEFAPILQTMRETRSSLQLASQSAAAADQRNISLIFVCIILGIGILVSTAFFSISRLIRKPLQQAVDLSLAIAAGELHNEVAIETRDETGELLSALANMQSQLQEQARVARQNNRVKQALDGVSSAVLMLDPDLTIVYRNDAADAMFREGLHDLRKALPGFDPDHLVGERFDCLYTQPAQEEQILRSLREPTTEEKKLGDRVYRITVSPVIDGEGERIGTVAEWMDRTAEIAIEEEVQTIVGAALQGDLGQRISMENKRGFFHALSAGVNELVSIAERAISDTVSAQHYLAKGSLTHRMDGDYKGIFAELKTDVNSTIEKLTEVVRNIQSGAVSVDALAADIADSNEELSARTEKQAATLEESASAMEEMTSSVQHTANNTSEANRLADAARNQAEAGGVIVNEAITAMKSINDSGHQIANIIGVIDEISFQTNLLALNAAVEAARAGEQGRGFAVVADEVRELAASSANAAREIKDLIDNSTQKITQGTELVNRSGDALKEIVHAVQDVTAVIAEITSASQQQAQGIVQVNQSIASMDERTQQNAAMVEKITSANSKLGEEAHKLNTMMKFFTIDAEKNGPVSG